MYMRNHMTNADCTDCDPITHTPTSMRVLVESAWDSYLHLNSKYTKRLASGISQPIIRASKTFIHLVYTAEVNMINPNPQQQHISGALVPVYSMTAIKRTTLKATSTVVRGLAHCPSPQLYGGKGDNACLLIKRIDICVSKFWRQYMW